MGFAGPVPDFSDDSSKEILVVEDEKFHLLERKFSSSLSLKSNCVNPGIEEREGLLLWSHIRVITYPVVSHKGNHLSSGLT